MQIDFKALGADIKYSDRVHAPKVLRSKYDKMNQNDVSIHININSLEGKERLALKQYQPVLRNVCDQTSWTLSYFLETQ